MKKINFALKFAKQAVLASLVILTSFSVAQAQRGGRGGFGGGGHGGFSGGGRSFGGGGGHISAAPRGGFGGGNFGGGGRISAAPRGNFGGGNRIAVGPRVGGRFYGGGVRAGISIRPGYSYRGYYGRPYRGIGYGAYYRSYYPHIGFYLNVLPFGYYPFYYGGYPYYYNEGLFYQQYNDGYQVVAPPVGAEVPRLPRKAQEIVIDGQQYFEKDGVYYQPIVNTDGKKVYRIAGKDGVLNTDEGVQQPQDDQEQYNGDDQQQYNNSVPQNNIPQTNSPQDNTPQDAMPRVGDVVNSIPADSRPVTINGEKLFVSPDGVYYQQDNSRDGKIYKVVGIPSSDGETEIAPDNQ